MARPPRCRLSAALLFAAGLAACGGDSQPPTVPPDPNRAPVTVGTIPSQTVTAGSSVTLDASQYFNDPDGDALTYAASSSDTNVATASTAGATVTIGGVAAGTATVTVTATDPDGLAASQGTSVTVEAANRAPVAADSIPGQTLVAGDSITLDASRYFSDPDGDALTYTASTSDTAVATASAEGGTVTIRAVAEGTATLTVTAADPGGLTASQSASVTVEAANQAPVTVGTIPGQTVTAGDSVTIDASQYFSDPDGDSLTYTASTSDTAVATASAEGGTVTIRAVAEGTATLTVTAADPGGLTASQSASVTVEAANRAPVTVDSIPGQTLVAGDSVTLDASQYFSDPDGDSLSYMASTSDSDIATASAEGGTVTIRAVAEGTATLSVTATDPGGLTASQGTGVTVQAANRAPVTVGTIPSQTVTAGGSVTLDASQYFNDPDGDALTYTASTSDTDIATASTEGGTVTIGAVAEGTAAITVTATDPGGLSATQETLVTVEAGSSLLRDDFDSSASLRDWYIGSLVRARVARGSLRLTNIRESYYGYVRRRVLDTDTDEAVPVTNWEASVRVARQQTNTRMMLWFWMDHDRYIDFALEIGSGREVDDQPTNYRFWIYDEDRDGPGDGGRIYIPDFGYGVSDAINDGPGQFTEVTLSVKNRRLEIIADGTLVFGGRLPSGFPTDITHVVLASAHTERLTGATALFDWVDIDGEETGGLRSAAAHRADRLPDLSKILADGKVEFAATRPEEVKRNR